MIVVISGIRDLHPESYPTVRRGIELALASRPREMRFGGAIGADTVALSEAFAQKRRLWLLTELVLYCVGTRAELPLRVRKDSVIMADRIVELHRDVSCVDSYHARNRDMLRGADRLVAFIDSRTTGGTYNSILWAAKNGIEVVRHELRDADADGDDDREVL